MGEDITKIYEEYTEQLLFCQYFIAERLDHKAEMGRCGENILKKCLQERFQMLEFVTGFIVCEGEQSPQCDILVCRKNMYHRNFEGGLYLVDPNDCLMVIEVKGNATLNDLHETLEKNKYFTKYQDAKHIKLALLAYRTRIGKKTLYQEFGYKYKKSIRAYAQVGLSAEKLLDYFICLHRDNIYNIDRSKQLFFLKDTQYRTKYIQDNNLPVMQNFFGLIRSMQE